MRQSKMLLELHCMATAGLCLFLRDACPAGYRFAPHDLHRDHLSGVWERIRNVKAYASEQGAYINVGSPLLKVAPARLPSR